MSSGSWVMFLSCRYTGTLVFLCCHPGRLARVMGDVPVVIAAVTLICLILNLVNHKSKIKHQMCIILLESGHHPYLRMAILK